MKKINLFVCVFLILTFQNQSYGVYASNINYDDGISFDQLKESIKNESIQSLEDTLKLIPSEFFDNYVLLYRSRSLQESSYENPRAIVFGQSARFIMAFNGHEKQKGFNNLETVQYKEDTKSWEFREITFLPGQTPLFSEANPKKCLECHQSPKRLDIDPRPNWEPYNFWPGVYGSVDDEIKPVLKVAYDKYLKGYGFVPPPISRFLPQDMLLIEEQALEQVNLEKFEDTKLNHLRYRFLPQYNTRNPLNLTKSLVSLNMRRVVRLAKSELGPLYENYKYALYGLGDFGSFKSSENLKHMCGKLYLPKNILEKHIQRTLEIKELKEKEYKEYGTRWRHGFAAGIDIIFEPLGVMTDDWSMDFKTKGRFSFGDRFTSPNFSPEHFLLALYNNYPQDPIKNMNCDQLQKASLKALNRLDETGAISMKIDESRNKIRVPAKPLMSRCMNCHVDIEFGSETAPYIPFDNFEKLKTMLGENKYKRGTLFDEIIYRTGDHVPNREQMPPAGIVDSKQRDEFINSLRALLN